MRSERCAVACVLSLLGPVAAPAQQAPWALGPFEKPHRLHAIIAPDPASTFHSPMGDSTVHWEENATFNPAAVVRDGRVYVLYRAEDASGDREIGHHTSRLGLAESNDGLTFTRRGTPVLYPDRDGQEQYEWPGGVEDPRLVETEDGTYLLTYTQWNRDVPRLAVATSKDLVSWRKHGPAFAKALGGKYLRTESKSGAILSRVEGDHLVATRVNGKYWMYFGVPDVRIATSDNLIDWTPVEDGEGRAVPVLSPRPGYFDSWLVEAGPPAILTPRGIVVLYNAGNSGMLGDPRLPDHVYTGGQALFDGQNPLKLLARLDRPFIEPTEDYERTGQYAAGTTFVEGLVPFNGKWYLYYGMADSRVGVAVSAVRDTVAPVLQFPEPGLDDPAAYQGYQTRLYRDARQNVLQVYLDGRAGRVVHLWADAADESVGFTARAPGGGPAALAWASTGAVVGATGETRSVSYRLLLGPGPVRLGLFVLGSMRVERDFHYQARDSLPLGVTAFPQPELLRLIANVEHLQPEERQRQLALLKANTADELRARLEPDVRLVAGTAAWTVRVTQPGFDGRHRLSVTIAGDTGETEAMLEGQVVTLRSRSDRPVEVNVTVSTDAAALTPLARDEIFNDEFRRFYAAARADTARPLVWRRLEREVRGMELLCYGEKLMAGLPNFATYFGRDMLMTALLMQPVWAPAMPEHVIASALGKLSPTGEVSHEEALGGQAIRENAAEYNRLIAAGQMARARAVLANLAATRENYIMVDDDYQLPVVVARYLTDPRVPADRKRAFLSAEHRLPRLLANLAFVARQTEPYVREPVPTNLVSFPRAPDDHWIGASWRDSRAGYGGGRFAMDVNVIWTLQALESIGTVLDELKRLGLATAVTDEPLATYGRNANALARAVTTWRGAERHFRVALAPQDAARRVDARVRWLPEGEADSWRAIVRHEGPPEDSLRFLALSLAADGRPIPIVNTDPAMLLLLGPLSLDRTLALVDPITRPYPWGLFVNDLGPVTSNDAYATPEVWDAFRRDPYHSPTVVWGRDVNILLAGLALQMHAAAPGTDVSALRDALRRTVNAVERSGLRHAELWSYRIEDGRLIPSRYGTSSDVQLWSLTDLAVQYLLSPSTP